jgi:DNA-binding NarL/FixJ family response regulator
MVAYPPGCLIPWRFQINQIRRFFSSPPYTTFSYNSSQDSTHIMLLIERVSEGVRIEDVRDLINLTQREQIVVQLLSEGKTNKEIAVYMAIGEYTVKDHVKKIMKKLNVTTRAGIVAKILQSYHLS